MIRGRVQGVGFRHFVSTRARALALAGEVRNRPDGAVEVTAEGDAESLRGLLEAVRRGPPASQVSAVEEAWSDGPARYRGFMIAS